MTEYDIAKAKGGKARAEKLTPEQRRDIARKAGKARWSSSVPRIPKASYDGALPVGNLILPCYVITDTGGDPIRVLSARGISKAFTGKIGGGSGAQKIPRFLQAKEVKELISNELLARILDPFEFRPVHGGRSAYGYEATLLPEICSVILKANRAGAIRDPEMATVAETLLTGFAHIGIIALVDEATGYQEVREKKALAAILDAYLRKEYAAWAKRFPDEFYKEIFRLREWNYNPSSVKRPGVVAKYTNDLVYQRIAPGLLEELQQRNPKDEKGRRKQKHFQWMTEDVGDPALTQHIHALVILMRASKTWELFYESVNAALPKKNNPAQALLPGVKV